MKKRLSLFLVFALLFTASVPMLGVQAATLAGAGTAADPYQITSYEDLLAMESITGNYNREFKLMNNITMPKDTMIPYLEGQFDGDGHTIEVNITGIVEGNVGLFKYLKYGSGIRNLIVDGTVTAVAGNASASGFVALMDGANAFRSCVNKANVSNTGTGDGTAGVAGFAGSFKSGGIAFYDCVNEGTITGVNAAAAGGIVGRRTNSAIKEFVNCKNTGIVQADGYTGYVGGIAGDLRALSGSSSLIKLCSNYGKVTGNTSSGFVGGIVGYAQDITSIETSYNAGVVTNTNGSAGGILGYSNKATMPVTNCFNAGEVNSTKTGQKGYAIVYNNAAMSNSYNVYPGLPLTSMTSGGTNNYNILTVGIAAETGTTLLSAEAMKSASSYTDWDFETVWTTGNEAYPYPQQQENMVTQPITVPDPQLPDFTEGTGSVSDPYIIKTEDEFKKIKDNPGSAFKLANNIDLTNVEYVPFNFSGTLDGNDKTVKVAIKSTADTVGLFSTASGSVTIKNLTVAGSVEGKSYVGGLIGNASGMTSPSRIENCVNLATVTGTGERIGGIMGTDYPSSGRDFTFTDLSNEGKISGSDYVGGIIGMSHHDVKNSRNIAVIEAGRVAGGMIGWTYGKGASNCYNSGDIIARATVGGIIGLYEGDPAGRVENCYNTGEITVTASGNTVFGGILGEMGDAKSKKTLTIANCYNIGKARNAFAFNPITTVPTDTKRPDYIVGTIVETNCFYLSPEKEAASNGGASAPKTVEELKASAGDLGSAFAAGTGAYAFPQLVAVNNDAASPVFHVVTVTSNGNGTTTPNCPVYVADGKTLTIVPRAEDGYIVKEISFNGTAIPGVASYETPAITEDSAVIITFALPAPEQAVIPCTAAFSAVEGGAPMGIVFGTIQFGASNPIVEYGMLIASDVSIALEDFNLENSSVTIAKGVAAFNAKGQYGIKFIGAEMTGKTYSTRAYVKYADGTVLYGDILVPFTAQ